MSDGLTVVTVTYSPGPHLDRFLSTLCGATERPVAVIMADNGSTDGAPEEAVVRYPNVQLLRTGGNLGYGTGREPRGRGDHAGVGVCRGR